MAQALHKPVNNFTRVREHQPATEQGVAPDAPYVAVFRADLIGRCACNRLIQCQWRAGELGRSASSFMRTEFILIEQLHIETDVRYD